MKKIAGLLISSTILLSACGAGSTVPTPTTSPTPLITSSSTLSSTPIATPPPSGQTSLNCLQGNWSSDSSALTTYMRNTLPDMSPTVTNGSMEISFSGNNFTQGSSSLTVAASRPEMNMVITMSGTVSGTLTHTAPGQVTFRSTGTGGMRADSITVNGQPFIDAPIEFGDLLMGQQTQGSYQCNGNNLTLMLSLGDGRTATMMYTRR